MSILVSGGAGYIGSHTVIELIENGFDPIIVDNLCNSKKIAIDRLEKITGKKIKFYQYDLCDIAKLREVFEKEKIDACIHFAGLKAVGESCQKPLEYYQNNLISTLNLIQVMREYGCKNLVFSSSATVRSAQERTYQRGLPSLHDKSLRHDQVVYRRHTQRHLQSRQFL